MTRIFYPSDLQDDNNPYIHFQVIEYVGKVNVRDYNLTGGSFEDGLASLGNAGLEALLNDIKAKPNTIDNIYLPLPLDLNNEISPSWEMADSKLLTTVSDSVSQVANGQWGQAGSTISGAATAMIAGGLIKRVARLTPNPKKQAIFNGIEARTFGFRYTLTAMSERDANIIQDIVKKFMSYSLPSLENDTDAFFKFPYEYWIKIHGLKGAPKYSSAVCTTVRCDLAPSGMQILRTGHPIQVTLDLTFLETDLRTRESAGV